MARRSYIVAYDLLGERPASDYGPLIEALKANGTWGKLTESCWIVVSDSEAEAIRDDLLKYLKEEDRLFVGPIGKPAAWHNMRAKSEWIKARP